MGLGMYAALMGFIMAAPFGVIGAASALAAMQHKGKSLAQLLGGVLLADAVVITVVNSLITLLPNLTWEQVKAWAPLWWLMVVGLAFYGGLMLVRPATLSKQVLYPARPFWHALGWTLFANPKNWLGTFAAYAGWQALGLLPDIRTQLLIGGLAWLGGVVSWLIWGFVCWKAEKWHVQAESIAQKLVGWLCLLAAGSAAYTLLG